MPEMSLLEATIEIEGTSPLLMHAATTTNPLHPLTKQIKAITSKRSKTDQDYAEVADLEYEAGLYHDGSGPYIPGEMIWRTFIGGARLTKSGAKLERGILDLAAKRAPLVYKGPRSVRELVADPNFRDMRRVGVQSNSIMRCRPRFDQWSIGGTLDAVSLRFQFEANQINADELRACIESAGRFIGIGDGRKIGMGRFDLTSFEVAEA